MIINKKKLIFVHIPKTGGQTMMNILYQIFDYENVLKVWGKQSNQKSKNFSVSDFLNLELDFIQSYPCIGGHMTLNDLITKLGRETLLNDYSLYAIVRDPIDTVISLYNYYLTNTNHPKHKNFSQLSFEQFANTKYDKNIQCQFLGADNAYDAIYNSKYFFSNIVTLTNFDILLQEIETKFNQNQKIINTNIKNVSQKIINKKDLSTELIEKIKLDNYQDYLLFETIKTWEKGKRLSQ